MYIFKKLFKITAGISFVIIFIFFSTLQAKNLDKFNKAQSISDYFSGILHLSENQYSESNNFLKRLDGLESSHQNYSTKYLFSLVNSGKLSQAFHYSNKLERESKDSYVSDLITGVYLLGNSKFKKSKNYFLKAKNRETNSVFENYIANLLFIWSDLDQKNFDNAKIDLNKLDARFENLQKIQIVFLNCFFDKAETENLFKNLTLNQGIDFSRYNYFFAKYLINKGFDNKAASIVSDSLKKNPRNLLLNQLESDLQYSKKNFDFDCKKQTHVISEFLYITANVLSSQLILDLSNFYLNLAKHLNKDFQPFNTLMADNFYKTDNLLEAKKIYKDLALHGSDFKWYSNKQISKILIQEGKKEQSIKLLSKVYKELNTKGLYETFDFAEFLKNNEEFEKAVFFYTEILNKINKKHPLYPKVTDGRGVSYERLGEWDKAEKDLLASLDADPDQAYVINYLAYSWIEKGVKIDQSLNMLEKANKLKSNDPFIIDSLGWALFKLERYKESKDYLQLAVKLMPTDPIVNDHYGDVLWKNGKKIQARYYWNYVLDLERAEKDLKDKIEQKLIKGL